jgi:CMP-N-acetylneuraminic acid synthetase
MSKLCLVPAKAASTRLKKKNLRVLGEHSLLGHSILKAQKTGLFDEICVSTESEEVAEVAQEYGAQVPFLRPTELSVDPSTLIDVMLHALKFYKDQGMVFESITLILPTTPLLSVDDIKEAVSYFDSSDGRTVLSVSEYEHAIFNAWSINESSGGAILEPCFPDSPFKFTKSTECPKTYRANGGVLVANTNDLITHKTYRLNPMMPYVMPLERAVDIDTDFDFSLAEFIYSRNAHDWL